jgi:hypothetical protein
MSSGLETPCPSIFHFKKHTLTLFLKYSVYFFVKIIFCKFGTEISACATSNQVWPKLTHNVFWHQELVLFLPVYCTNGKMVSISLLYLMSQNYSKARTCTPSTSTLHCFFYSFAWRGFKFFTVYVFNPLQLKWKLLYIWIEHYRLFSLSHSSWRDL